MVCISSCAIPLLARPSRSSPPGGCHRPRPLGPDGRSRVGPDRPRSAPHDELVGGICRGVRPGRYREHAATTGRHRRSSKRRGGRHWARRERAMAAARPATRGCIDHNRLRSGPSRDGQAVLRRGWPWTPTDSTDHRPCRADPATPGGRCLRSRLCRCGSGRPSHVYSCGPPHPARRRPAGAPPTGRGGTPEPTRVDRVWARP